LDESELITYVDFILREAGGFARAGFQFLLTHKLIIELTACVDAAIMITERRRRE
jgi:hypothetical protein